MVEDKNRKDQHSASLSDFQENTSSFSQGAQLEPGKVLVIDDEEMLVQLMQRFLEISGIQSLGFTNPHLALEWYNKNHADIGLVILDLKMSGMDGKDVFTKMQEINPQVKVGFLSGFVERDVEQSLMRQGALRFFQKPLRYPELVEWIKSSLS